MGQRDWLGRLVASADVVRAPGDCPQAIVNLGARGSAVLLASRLSTYLAVQVSGQSLTAQPRDPLHLAQRPASFVSISLSVCLRPDSQVYESLFNGHSLLLEGEHMVTSSLLN